MSWSQLVPTKGGSQHAVAVAPSILSADFSHLADEVRAVEAVGVELLHVDVMDGNFVPNISFGSLVVSALNAAATVPLDTHLMIANPDKYIPDFIDAGADILTIHVEASSDVSRDLKEIRGRGAKCGLALNPDTSLALVTPHLEGLDLLLVMSVFPGFGGQKFIESVLEKIERAAALREQRGLDFAIEIDGGIGAESAVSARGAGVDVLVAGTAIFKESDYGAAVQAIRG